LLQGRCWDLFNLKWRTRQTGCTAEWLAQLAWQHEHRFLEFILKCGNGICYNIFDRFSLGLWKLNDDVGYKTTKHTTTRGITTPRERVL
jgi:hypothetical protein